MKPVVSLLSIVLLVSPALAVKTQHFTNTSAEDFKKGTTTNVVITSTGQLRLGRLIEPLLPKDRHFDAIQAIAEAPDGAIVFSAFPDGDVLRLKDGKLTTLASFKDRTVTALTYDTKGRLLMGVGGDQAQLVRIDKPGDGPQVVCEPKDAKFIWAIVAEADATFLATGPHGGVFKVDADGNADSFADLAGDNVTCLTADKASLYAGTDTDALVYKIDRQTAKPFVLFEADESEISALAWDNHGNLLAATSDPQTEPGRNDVAPPENGPAKGAPSHELPAKKPAAPKPPDEKPGDAIPHATAAPVNVPTSGPTKMIEPPTPTDEAAKPDATATSTGNAVYRIDPKGLVTELFRKSSIFYGLAVRGDKVLISTGEDGEVFEIDAETGEEAVLVRTDAPDATGLLSAKDGTLYVATSNAGQILKMSAEHAKHGTYESDVLDAGLPSTFGQLHLLGTIPAGTTLTVQTRAGNIDDPEDAGWSPWTPATPAKAFTPITSPTARYLQYRLTLETTDFTKSAVVDEVDVAYQKPNLPPKLGALTVTPGAEPGLMNVTWEAVDGNEDELRYGVYVRAVGAGPWMKIADDLTESSHTWNAKGVADGQYELKVTASDARANPPGEGREVFKVSDGVLVDNTPPTVGDVKVSAAGGKATVTFHVVDRSGTVASVETTLDAVDHWQKRLPDDTIADSPEEWYTVSLSGLDKGSHTLLIRATDARGNASFETVAVTVP